MILPSFHCSSWQFQTISIYFRAFYVVFHEKVRSHAMNKAGVYGKSISVLRHILSLRYVLRQIVTNLMHCLHVLSLRYVLSLRSDKTCRKIHSLHVLSPLRQQHYSLSSPSFHVCVCVFMCICPWQPARARECVVVYCVVFYYPTSISAKQKICIALSRLRGYCCCVQLDYRSRN